MARLPSNKNKTDDWLTPPELVSAFGDFDLDPCASVRQSSPLATNCFHLPDQNGLLLPWHGRVWCNPPYSSLPAWASKFALHDNGIMLCPLRLRVRWSQILFDTADAILLIRDNIRWISFDGVTKLGDIFDFMLVAYGHKNVAALPRCPYKHSILYLTNSSSRVTITTGGTI